jgi:hypothetical protein
MKKLTIKTKGGRTFDITVRNDVADDMIRILRLSSSVDDVKVHYKYTCFRCNKPHNAELDLMGNSICPECAYAFEYEK